MANEKKVSKEDRPIRKIMEHLEDAMIHLHQSNFSEEEKESIGHKIVEAGNTVQASLKANELKAV